MNCNAMWETCRKNLPCILYALKPRDVTTSNVYFNLWRDMIFTIVTDKTYLWYIIKLCEFILGFSLLCVMIIIVQTHR